MTEELQPAGESTHVPLPVSPHRAATLLRAGRKSLWLPGTSKHQGPDELQKARKASVQTPIPGMGLVIRFATYGDKTPVWWSPQRDQFLGKFWPTEDLLAGAIYSVVARNAAFRWRLDGPELQVKRCMQVLTQAHLGAGWQGLISRLTLDLLTQDNGCFLEVIRPAQAATKEFGVLKAVQMPSRDADGNSQPEWFGVGRGGALLPLRDTVYEVKDSPMDLPLGIAHLDAQRCLGRDSRVTMADGTVKAILDIVREQDPGPVIAMGEDGVLRPRAVIGWHATALGNRHWLRVHLAEAQHTFGRPQGLWLTNDHEVLTPDGWRRADSLSVGDQVVTQWPTPNQHQTEIIVGSLLGDGSLRCQGRYAALDLVHGEKQEAWLRQKQASLVGMGWNKDRWGTGGSGRRFVCQPGTATPTLSAWHRRWYPDGKMQLCRDDVAANLTPLMLAVWYLDDGDLQKRRWGYPSARFGTQNFAIADVRWLAEQMTSAGYAATCHEYGGYAHLYITASGSRRLFHDIGAYVPESLRYKLPPDAPAYDERLWDVGPCGNFADTVASIEAGDNGEQATAFCIDVEEDHNFCAAGMVVHNCVRTGDPDYPVIYYDLHGVEHALSWWQVITLEDMPSPREIMAGVGYSAVSRCLRTAQVLRDINVYNSEKVSGRFVRAVHITNADQQAIQDVITEASENNDNEGLLRYVQPLIVSTIDPQTAPAVATINLASMPDAFNMESFLKWYIAGLALALGTDYGFLAPLPGGNLGTASQSETADRQSKGKSSRLFMQTLTHKLMYSGVLPESVEFDFREIDYSEEAQRDAGRELRSKTRAERIASGEITAQVARQMASDDGDLAPEYLEMMQEQDLTDDVTMQDAEREAEKLNTEAVVAGAPGPTGTTAGAVPGGAAATTPGAPGSPPAEPAAVPVVPASGAAVPKAPAGPVPNAPPNAQVPAPDTAPSPEATAADALARAFTPHAGAAPGAADVLSTAADALAAAAAHTLADAFDPAKKKATKAIVGTVSSAMRLTNGSTVAGPLYLALPLAEAQKALAGDLAGRQVLYSARAQADVRAHQLGGMVLTAFPSVARGFVARDLAEAAKALGVAGDLDGLVDASESRGYGSTDLPAQGGRQIVLDAGCLVLATDAKASDGEVTVYARGDVHPRVMALVDDALANAPSTWVASTQRVWVEARTGTKAYHAARDWSMAADWHPGDLVLYDADQAAMADTLGAMVKGGPGSGGFGHAGRPGHVGGSASGSTQSATSTATQAAAPRVLPTQASHPLAGAPAKVWLTPQDQARFGAMLDKAFAKAPQLQGATLAVKNGPPPTVTDHGRTWQQASQWEHGQGAPNAHQQAGHVTIWQRVMSVLSRHGPQRASAPFFVQWILHALLQGLHTYMGLAPGRRSIDVGEKGGPGSGNFAHAGRPGKVGGSSPKAGGGEAEQPEPSHTATEMAATRKKYEGGLSPSALRLKVTATNAKFRARWGDGEQGEKECRETAKAFHKAQKWLDDEDAYALKTRSGPWQNGVNARPPIERDYFGGKAVGQNPLSRQEAIMLNARRSQVAKNMGLDTADKVHGLDQRLPFVSAGDPANQEQYNWLVDNWQAMRRADHKRLVAKALTDGERIDPDVLGEYPNLVKGSMPKPPDKPKPPEAPKPPVTPDTPKPPEPPGAWPDAVPLVGNFSSTSFAVDAKVTDNAAIVYMATFAEMPEWARRNVSKVELHDHSGAPFTANGETYKEGGNWIWTLGKINVFGDSAKGGGVRTSDDTGWFLYHEAGHGVYSAWVLKATYEVTILGAARPEAVLPTLFRGRLVQSLNPEYLAAHRAELTKSYPYLVLKHDWDTAWQAGEDGVTSYSKSWAKDRRSKDCETFAEIAKYALGYGTPHGLIGVDTDVAARPAEHVAKSHATARRIARQEGAPTLMRVFDDLTALMQADLEKTPHDAHRVRAPSGRTALILAEDQMNQKNSVPSRPTRRARSVVL